MADVDGGTVKYRITLEDDFSGTVKKDEEAVGGLEHRLEGAKEFAGEFRKELLETVGVYEGIRGMFEFMKESVEDFNEKAQAQAQLQASLASTRSAAGLTAEELNKLAEETERKTNIEADAITKLQSQMLTFTSITKETFPQAQEAIVNLAAKMGGEGGGDLQGAMLQVSKALQDPIRGITALRRVGVSFNESQRQMIDHLVQTGQTAKAQQLILKELNTEFGGSAEAAAKAGTGPLKGYGLQMKEIRENIGDLIVKGIQALGPAIQGLIDIFRGSIDRLKEFLDWCGRNKDMLTTIAWVVGTVAGAILLYNAYVKISEGVTIAWTAALEIYEAVMDAGGLATLAMTAAQYAWNLALSLNPIGIVIAAIGALVAVIIYCWNHFEKFRGAVMGVWEALKTFVHDIVDVYMNVFTGLGKIIVGVFTFDKDKIAEGFNQARDAMAQEGKKLVDSFNKGYKEGVDDFQAEHKQGLVGSAGDAAKKGTAAGQNGPATTAGNGEVKGVTGPKQLTLNVTIKNLVENLNIRAKDFKEGVNEMKNGVVTGLIDATNDFQITAGQ